jgi:uncharacterized protein YbjQ (UPF0145 family)
MIQTTTPTVDNRAITEYLGIVTGEAILGANIVRDLFAGVRDIVGGRSGAYEEELRKAREIALSEMEAEAQSRGADAIVGVDLDYETIAFAPSSRACSTISSIASVRARARFCSCASVCAGTTSSIVAKRFWKEVEPITAWPLTRPR